MEHNICYKLYFIYIFINRIFNCYKKKSLLHLYVIFKSHASVYKMLMSFFIFYKIDFIIFF